MNKLTIMAATALAAALACGAQANELLATFTGSGPESGDNASWKQLFEPTPTSYLTGFGDLDYTTIAVYGYSDTVSSGYAAQTVSYYPTAAGGGWSDAAGDFEIMGPQVYTGTEDAPVFSAGQYTETNGTLTLTSVPEPAAWTMMLIGVGLAGAARRRRRLAV